MSNFFRSESKYSLPVIIFAGGKGARFDHESQVLPKPLIEVAGKPILGHIMDSFEDQGFKKFYILGGYKCEKIKEYLSTRYDFNESPQNYPKIHCFGNKGKRVATHLFNTGEDATTGDRLMYLVSQMMLDNAIITYGDGLCDVDYSSLVDWHRSINDEPHMTVTTVRPPGRFGVVEFDDEKPGVVKNFGEKPSDGWINGGFMVVDNSIFIRYACKPVPGEIPDFCGKIESFESGAMVRAASAGKMYGYRHTGYWRCMDTRRDLEQIEEDVKTLGYMPWRKNGDISSK